MILPEGTQSNGKYLIPFKRGAFESLMTVIPIVTIYTKCTSYMRPSWECLGFLEQIFLVGTAPGYYTAELIKLPPFKPNDYLYEKFADKGKTKAAIFAWAAREVMAKAGNLPTIEVTSREKAIYKDFMTGKTDEIEANGKIFTAPPIHSIFPCMPKRKKRVNKDKPKSE